MIVNDMIKQLLRNKREEELRIELDGYPADFLDDPIKKRMKTESYKHMIDGEDYIRFKVFTMTDDDMQLSDLYSTDRPYYCFSVNGKRMSMQTVKLQKLLYKGGDSTFRRDASGEGFYLKIKVKQLLESATTL